MAKDVKIVKSKTAPVDKNVLWDDGENLKINRNGKWESANNTEIFIPDTVLKTTPQELSDTDKNQALANLGIDPVALKYIIKPLELDYEGGVMELPEDLANIVLTNSRFNQSVLNMIVGWGGDGYYSVTKYDYIYDYGGIDYPVLWFNGACYGLDVDSLLFMYLEGIN